jgi:hypothetical protein
MKMWGISPLSEQLLPFQAALCSMELGETAWREKFEN